MGCGASTPVKHDSAKKTTTSAASHRDMRKRESSQLGVDLDVGPDYARVKHLGTALCYDLMFSRAKLNYLFRNI